MKTAELDRRDCTAVRHGELKAFIEFLKGKGFKNLIITFAQREDLGKLPEEKRIYGQLEKGDKILFIEAPREKGKMPKNFYNIVIE